MHYDVSAVADAIEKAVQAQAVTPAREEEG
jgi:hypothetical protein